MSKLVFYTHICCLLYGVSSLKFQQEALIWLVTCTFSWCQSSEYEWNFMKFSHIPTQVLKTIFTTKNQNPIHTKKFYIKYSDFFRSSLFLWASQSNNAIFAHAVICTEYIHPHVFELGFWHLIMCKRLLGCHLIQIEYIRKEFWLF